MPTSEEPLERKVTEHIERAVATATTSTKYRRPLVAYVSADHPDFARLKALIDPSHLLPGDILEGARTVVSFFVPFDAGVVKANARGEETAREWAVAYVETNALIGQNLCHSGPAAGGEWLRRAVGTAHPQLRPGPSDQPVVSQERSRDRRTGELWLASHGHHAGRLCGALRQPDYHGAPGTGAAAGKGQTTMSILHQRWLQSVRGQMPGAGPAYGRTR